MAQAGNGRHRQTPVTQREYETLAAFRGEIRRFLRFSEEAVRHAGLSPQQHQLLLTVQGMPGGRAAAAVKEIAEHLQLRHHSVVELIDRMAAAALVERHPAAADHRTVEIRLTPQGAQVLRDLTGTHKEEVRRMAGVFHRLSEILDDAWDPAQGERP